MRVGLEEHFQQRGHLRVGSRFADRGPARGTRVRVGSSSGVGGSLGRLPREPFLDAGSAESVQAVEEGEGLVEDLGTDLQKVPSQRFWSASWKMGGRRKELTRTRPVRIFFFRGKGYTLSPPGLVCLFCTQRLGFFC